MAGQSELLSYAVRIPVVLKYLGQLCLMIAALTLVPLGVCIMAGDFLVSLRYAAVVLGLAGLGFTLSRLRGGFFFSLRRW